jgi:hypothetical protein
MKAPPMRLPAGWLLLFFLPLLTGCELVGDIFKLGLWAGVLMIGFFAVIAYVAFRFLRRS